MTSARIILIAKRSAFAKHVEDAEDPRARLLLKRRDPSVKHWRKAHDEHRRTLDAVQKALKRLGARTLVLRRPHAAFDASGADLVVTVGGDGTLLAASHSVSDIPILGVNSAPDHSIGFFCAAKRANIEEMLDLAIRGRLKKVRLNRMRVAVNGRIRSRGVLNDVLFCHRSPAATSRYIIEHRGRKEEQRSSGMWVGPAAGSTAAQKSAGGRVLPLGSKKIQLVVREPYVPRGQTYKLMRILVSPGEKLIVRSKMNDALMFVDGPYKKIAVALGDTITFSNSDQPLTVLGLSRR